MARTAVIIVAGGSGNRMGAPTPKQFLFLGNEPILARTLRNFAEALPEARIVIVLPEAHIAYWHDLAARFDLPAHTVVAGGRERFHSVRQGLQVLPEETEVIAVQDGVRPLASRELILRTIAAAENYGAAIPAVAPVDSVRIVDGERSRPLDRSGLRMIQTPQAFRADLLRKAYDVEFRPEFTDDASVVEAAGYPVALCEGERQNIKITTPEDLLHAEAILQLSEDSSAR